MIFLNAPPIIPAVLWNPEAIALPADAPHPPMVLSADFTPENRLLALEPRLEAAVLMSPNASPIAEACFSGNETIELARLRIPVAAFAVPISASLPASSASATFAKSSMIVLCLSRKSPNFSNGGSTSVCTTVIICSSLGIKASPILMPAASIPSFHCDSLKLNVDWIRLQPSTFEPAFFALVETLLVTDARSPMPPLVNINAACAASDVPITLPSAPSNNVTDWPPSFRAVLKPCDFW